MITTAATATTTASSTTEAPVVIGFVGGVPLIVEEGKGRNKSEITLGDRKVTQGYVFFLGEEATQMYAAWYAAAVTAAAAAAAATADATAATVVTKTNGFDRPLHPFLVRNGVRIFMRVGSNTWHDDGSVTVTMKIPEGVVAGIEKFNDETSCGTPGHRVSSEVFVRVCAASGVVVEIDSD